MTTTKTILFAAVAAAGLLGGCVRERAVYYPAYQTGGYAYQPYQPYQPLYVPPNYAGQNAPQNYAPQFAPQAGAAATAPQANSDLRFSNEQLDQILGPIALYPDPLLTEILAAATYPNDIAELDALLKTNPSPSDDELNAKTWDNSVKALAKYPSVVQMMASGRDWCAGIGAAMVNQQQDVMDSIQRLRAQARAAQTLNTTPQQEVIADGGVIQILPAQPEIIYVPVYDPLVVYTPQPFGTDCIWFGIGIGINRFWDLDCDWRHHEFHHGVRWGHDWHHPLAGGTGHWEHNHSQPIPAPTHAFVPPRGVDGRVAGAHVPTLSTAPQHTLAQPKPIAPQRVSVPMAPTASPRQVGSPPHIVQETPRFAPQSPRIISPGAPTIAPSRPSMTPTETPRFVQPPQTPVTPHIPAMPALPARPAESHVAAPFSQPAMPSFVPPEPRVFTPAQVPSAPPPQAHIDAAPQRVDSPRSAPSTPAPSSHDGGGGGGGGGHGRGR